MRLLVLGAGATGGYFGGRLAQAGVDVTFLVRERRREQLDRDGVRIRSPLGDLALSVQTVGAKEVGPGWDLVLLTCKAYDLESAMDAIAPAMSGPCAVIPILNGLAHFDRLDARFGRRNVLGGTCAINTTLGKDGEIVHGDPLQRLAFGERDGTKTASAQAFAEALARTSLDWVLSPDIEQELWEKIVFLSALAATTCLFRANVREILAAPGGLETMERALRTNMELASLEGHAPRATAVEFARTRLTDPNGTWSASMLRDVEAGAAVESDPIIGWMLERARKHGLDTSILSLAYTHLKAYEARRAAGRVATR